MTTTKTLPSQSRLRSLFNYNPLTGRLRWKRRPRADFRTHLGFRMWNAKFAGKVAGTKIYKADGRPAGMHVLIDHRPYKVHRVIWVMLFGQIPDGKTPDHKDRNPFNNRRKNLRLATPEQQSANRRTTSHNRVGIRGVTRVGRGTTYRARIKINGRDVHLGCFPTAQAAALAYERESLKVYGEFSSSVASASAVTR